MSAFTSANQPLKCIIEFNTKSKMVYENPHLDGQPGRCILIDISGSMKNLTVTSNKILKCFTNGTSAQGNYTIQTPDGGTGLIRAVHDLCNRYNGSPTSNSRGSLTNSLKGCTLYVITDGAENCWKVSKDGKLAIGRPDYFGPELFTLNESPTAEDVANHLHYLDVKMCILGLGAKSKPICEAMLKRTGVHVAYVKNPSTAPTRTLMTMVDVLKKQADVMTNPQESRPVQHTLLTIDSTDPVIKHIVEQSRQSINDGDIAVIDSNDDLPMAHNVELVANPPDCSDFGGKDLSFDKLYIFTGSHNCLHDCTFGDMDMAVGLKERGLSREEAIGAEIKIFFTSENSADLQKGKREGKRMFVVGHIDDFDGKLHKVRYKDGKSDWYDLKMVKNHVNRQNPHDLEMKVFQKKYEAEKDRPNEQKDFQELAELKNRIQTTQSNIEMWNSASAKFSERKEAISVNLDKASENEQWEIAAKYQKEFQALPDSELVFDNDEEQDFYEQQAEVYANLVLHLTTAERRVGQTFFVQMKNWLHPFSGKIVKVREKENHNGVKQTLYTMFFDIDKTTVNKIVDRHFQRAEDFYERYGHFKQPTTSPSTSSSKVEMCTTPTRTPAQMRPPTSPSPSSRRKPPPPSHAPSSRPPSSRRSQSSSSSSSSSSSRKPPPRRTTRSV